MFSRLHGSYSVQLTAVKMGEGQDGGGSRWGRVKMGEGQDGGGSRWGRVKMGEGQDGGGSRSVVEVGRSEYEVT